MKFLGTPFFIEHLWWSLLKILKTQHPQLKKLKIWRSKSFKSLTPSLKNYHIRQCKKYRNFTWFPSVEILRKGTVSNRPKLCGNCVFPQNFDTRKTGEVTVFFAVRYSNQFSNIVNTQASLLSLMSPMGQGFKFHVVVLMMYLRK